MKLLILSLILSTSAFAHQEEGLISRVEKLELKLAAMEEALEEKLGKCELKYVRYGQTLNNCPRGAFVDRVFPLGNGATQISCGYYKVVCEKE